MCIKTKVIGRYPLNNEIEKRADILGCNGYKLREYFGKGKPYDPTMTYEEAIEAMKVFAKQHDWHKSTIRNGRSLIKKLYSKAGHIEGREANIRITEEIAKRMEYRETILNIIKENPNGIRRYKLKEELEKKCMIKLTDGGVEHVLIDMEKMGKFKVERFNRNISTIKPLESA